MVVCVGENINIMSKTIGPAMKERKAEPILEMARYEEKVGIDYLDLNIGPSRKAGQEIMDWIVKLVQGAVNKPLSLDTTNPEAMEAGLKTHKGKAIDQLRLPPARAAGEGPAHGQELIRPTSSASSGERKGCPGTPTSGRPWPWTSSTRPTSLGIPTEDIWIDPIVSPVSVEINQVLSCLEFMSMLKDIAPGSQIHRRALQHLQRDPEPPSAHPEPDLPGHADEVRAVLGHRRRL